MTRASRPSFLFVTLVGLVGLVAIIAPGALTACGDDGPDSPDATPSPDAATLQGSWALTSQTLLGSPSPAASLDGALMIAANDFAFASISPPQGILTTYTVSGDGHTLMLAGGTTLPFTFDAATPKLTFFPGTDEMDVASPDRSAPALTVNVAGTVTAPSTPTYTNPTVLLAFLQRDEPGFVNGDSRNYLPLTFTGTTATYAFNLNREALGTERITFGSTAAVAIAYVIAFEDRNGNGKLDDLFTPCSASTVDCVIGMSPIVLTFRDGTSAQMTASPYAYTHEGGWAQALVVTDARGGGSKSGLVSLDAGKLLHFDVALWSDPSTHTVPDLDLTVPAKR